MEPTPKNSRDVKKLLYEQVPLLIEKLKCCDDRDCYPIVCAVLEITSRLETIPD